MRFSLQKAERLATAQANTKPTPSARAQLNSGRGMGIVCHFAALTYCPDLSSSVAPTATGLQSRQTNRSKVRAQQRNHKVFYAPAYCFTQQYVRSPVPGSVRWTVGRMHSRSWSCRNHWTGHRENGGVIWCGIVTATTTNNCVFLCGIRLWLDSKEHIFGQGMCAFWVCCTTWCWCAVCVCVYKTDFGSIVFCTAA